MSDDLLSFYEKELAFLRQSGAEFARAYPKVASRLRISEEVVEDPHVSRLLEGVAYLNARIQKKIADDFPELTDALLDNLYPHYLRPLPSLAVVQFVPENDLDTTVPVKKGTLLETDAIKGRPCSFQTVFDMTIQPIKIPFARYRGKPFATPGANEFKGAESVIHLRLELSGEDMVVGDMALENLRFFLKGQARYTYPLYQAVLHEARGVVIASGDGEYRKLAAHTIKPLGFEESEGIVPYPPGSFPGYRLLTEFMAFPEKFLFFELTGLKNALERVKGNVIDIYIYTDRADADLERHVDESMLALNCCPIVNLFPCRAEPISLEYTQDSYKVIPDARFPHHYEVYAIEKVTGVSGSGLKVEYKPFYGLSHADIESDSERYWTARRQEVFGGEPGNEPGSCTELSLVDLAFDVAEAEDETLSIETLCFNGNMPEKLPFGGGQPYLKCNALGVPLARINTLTRITNTCRPPQGNGARWRLVSQLSLNHLSLTGESGTSYFREILALYDVVESSATKAMIKSVLSLKTSSITAPVTYKGKTTVCRGTEIEVTFDESMLSGHSVYLFASVLERFFAMYCSINSFTRMVARLKGKAEVLKKWPPRAGEIELI
ncbi:MAG: type VI secretion system baseplate subunit TssF [Gammaproteobacteria bacterium]|nr:MAG: type VI secretion system baseplate subunit TssF [Pseudomonadota bacterium]PIE37973.1 MAG: type VI secretion system baseplate subunit TssF [Gammaproteobacteria bacterium]